MMKKHKSKEISGDEPESKNKSEGEAEPKKTSLMKIRCIRDCDMPMIGLFEAGDVIDDPDLINKIGDNPNFEKLSEEEQS